MKPNNDLQLESRWPHRIAVLLVCTTFPLIWVGGLVTTYDAGMAIPDWPETYGHHMLLYPWTTWFAAPFDIFVEHGHRLLGVTTGAISVALLVVVWRNDRRIWMRRVAIAALLMVICQGTLGGLRVKLHDTQFALIHGCFGPLFFGLTVAMATFTSRRWATIRSVDTNAGRRICLAALFTAGLSYLQLVVGAHLRHQSVECTTTVMRLAVMFHLILAFVLLAHILYLSILVGKERRNAPWLVVPSAILVGLLLIQIALGIGSWVVNYGWPGFMADYQFAAAYSIDAKSFFQAGVVTAHVANGSLILVVSTLITIRAWRLFTPKWNFAPNLPDAKGDAS